MPDRLSDKPAKVFLQQEQAYSDVRQRCAKKEEKGFSFSSLGVLGLVTIMSLAFT